MDSASGNKKDISYPCLFEDDYTDNLLLNVIDWAQLFGMDDCVLSLQPLASEASVGMVGKVYDDAVGGVGCGRGVLARGCVFWVYLSWMDG